MSSQKKDELRKKLTRTRQEFLLTVEGWNTEQWNTVIYSEGQNWRAVDVLRHVTDAERSMTLLMQRIQQGVGGVPEDFDLDRWNAARINKAQDKNPEDLFMDMADNRAALLEFLDGLQPDDWSKEGRHGSMQILSIEAILHLIADHESIHLQHLRASMGV